MYKKTNDINEGNKTITIKNKGSESKSFDITYEYSKPKTGVLDAQTNQVAITTSSQAVTVAGGASADLTATIRIPSTAKTGRYEGYVNIVNHDNPSETYRLPFAVRVVDKGIGNSIMANPAISQVLWKPAHPFMPVPGLAYLQYRLNSPMKSVRIFIYDKDGQMLGTTTPREEATNAATKLLDRDIFAGFDTGDYYQYVGDPNEVKSLPSTTPHGKLTDGQYYAQIRAVDLDGTTKYLSPLQLFVIDNTLPKLKFKDHAPGKVYELKDSDFTTEMMNGNPYNAFWVHTNVYDEGTSKLAPLGMTQSSNILWYYYNQKFFPDGDFPIDDKGNAKFGIEKQDIEKGPATMILFPMDKAGNAHLLNEFYHYAFIKEGSPYVVPTYDKQRVSLNDTLTMTLDLNNVEKLMSGSYDASFYKDYLQFADVKVNKKFQEYADAHGITVKVDDPVINPNPVMNSQDIVKVGAHLTGDEGFSGDIPFLDVTFKVKNDEWNVLWNTINADVNTTTFSYTKQGETKASEIPAFNQVNSFRIIPKHSYVTSFARLQGVTAPLADNGISKFVTSAYAQSADGKKYPGTVADDNFIDIHGIPLSTEPYDIVFEAPGFLKSIQKVQLGTKTSWGEDIGELKFVAGTQLPALAGDVNGDGIIDVLDAKQVFDKMGQGNTENYLIEDFNKDGIVDKKDMQSVASNIYKKNPDVTAKPKEVIKVDGKDMYATNYFNLTKTYSNVNTFKVASKTSQSVTLNWLAVDPVPVWGGLRIQQQSSVDGITWPDDFTWTNAELASPITGESTSAVVKGLKDNTFYRFRLIVTGGLNGTLNGGKSNVVQLTTAFMTPTVDTVDDNDTTITGKADPGVTIEVYNQNLMVAAGQTDTDGNYSIDIKSQKAGTVLDVIASDDLGRQKEVSVTVLDRTAPIVPTINAIDDNDKSISGITEANATVVVKNNNNSIATGKANEEGKFNIVINSQKAGSVLTVIATDAAGNTSETASITVLDRTAPNAPKVNPIDDNDSKISGLTEANAKIVVKSNNKVIVTGTADSTGKFSITITKQKAGTSLSVTATDKAGNQSTATTIKVLDKTAPNAPKISSLTIKNRNQVSIKGTAEAYSTLYVKVGSKVVTKITVSTGGTFTVNLTKLAKGNNTITLYAIDRASNKSVEVKRTVTIK
ncbi:Ig-like domain-containing protein [Gottfriedia acidiceleris]|uniref:Ig-like domain-containing protein n=1 Tax=Gottfriedia acidiceleris TaxID=371036 RepID=UPI003AF3243C